ncbi:serine/threonine-protein kinase [Clostridium ganghwense]|uniref:non-specific serine/threonine protein kinase n=1 Tax=Clostridium ganghwense TaxID=312089 RepID=A0ABT4CML5_9CLOT|nr:serine/threonine-protein kinase [Clostridium ganghwense]MCY6369331.1 serine/threonine-protein kinase [Clostridium ganghwense]
MLNKGHILDEKYEVIKVLGKSDMGAVYLCKNIRLESLWTIKEVKEEFKKNIGFLLESNILKKLRHRGISKTVDIFFDNDNLYMVREYIDGQTLNEYLKKNKFIETKDIYHIASSICDIIAYLHSANPPIVYRNLKPSNILITPNGKVSLIDFGISKIDKIDENQQYDTGQSNRQTDIYNIGELMYFMATGKVPSISLEPLIDDNYDNDVDSNFKKIIQKCFQIDIKERYASVEELNNEIIVEMLKKNKDENTSISISSNINQEVSKENTVLQDVKKLQRSLIGVLALIVIIFIIT